MGIDITFRSSEGVNIEDSIRARTLWGLCKEQGMDIMPLESEDTYTVFHSNKDLWDLVEFLDHPFRQKLMAQRLHSMRFADDYRSCLEWLQSQACILRKNALDGNSYYISR